MKSIILILVLGLISSVYAQWRTSTDTDKMTGDKSSYAVNNWSVPTERMSFPYSDVIANIGIGCDKSSSWIYLVFSHVPNLSRTETRNGYNRIESRIKFDDKVETVTLTQDWGSKFIHFLDREYVINKVKKSKKMLIEFDWYENGLTYFEFNLEGADEAINSIYSTCDYKTVKEEVKKEKKNTKINLTAKIIQKQKEECKNKGGSESWDFKKDTFKCVSITDTNENKTPEIILTTKTIQEQKEECNNKGGSRSWDFQKDIFKCIYVKDKKDISDINQDNNPEIILTTKTIQEQKEECRKKGGSQGWDFQKDIFKCQR